MRRKVAPVAGKGFDRLLDGARLPRPGTEEASAQIQVEVPGLPVGGQIEAHMQQKLIDTEQQQGEDQGPEQKTAEAFHHESSVLMVVIVPGMPVGAEA